MLDCLPDHIEPVGLADAGRSFRGKIAVAEMSRLNGLLESTRGEIAVELGFRIDERRIRALSGRLSGQISVICQRCLSGMPVPVDIAFRLGIVTSELEASQLPEGYEALLATGDPMLLKDIVEDEIILALPIIPRHEDDAQCEVTVKTGSSKREKPNPFAVLKQLKTR